MQQLNFYDFTKFQPNGLEQSIEFMNSIAKKWVFQLEKTEDGKQHYQGRFSLIKRKRLSELIELCKGSPMEGANFQPTSTEGCKTFSYMMKMESRLAGPWKDDDEPLEKRTRVVAKLEASGLYPWQQQVLDSLKIYDDRKINVLISVEGNIGGSSFFQYLRFHKKAVVVPPFPDFKDMCRMIMCKKACDAYVIDMPRNLNVMAKAGFWNGVETLKNGYCFDDRFKFKDRMMDPPVIWIKTNEMPDMKMFSEDRWVIWGVDDDKKLCLIDEV